MMFIASIACNYSLFVGFLLHLTSLSEQYVRWVFVCMSVFSPPFFQLVVSQLGE